VLLSQPVSELRGILPPQPVEPGLQAGWTTVRKPRVGNRLVAVEANTRVRRVAVCLRGQASWGDSTRRTRLAGELLPAAVATEPGRLSTPEGDRFPADNTPVSAIFGVFMGKFCFTSPSSGTVSANFGFSMGKLRFAGYPTRVVSANFAVLVRIFRFPRAFLFFTEGVYREEKKPASPAGLCPPFLAS
jgi:hypothetical protein